MRPKIEKKHHRLEKSATKTHPGQSSSLPLQTPERWDLIKSKLLSAFIPLRGLRKNSSDAAELPASVTSVISVMPKLFCPQPPSDFFWNLFGMNCSRIDKDSVQPPYKLTVVLKLEWNENEIDTDAAAAAANASAAASTTASAAASRETTVKR